MARVTPGSVFEKPKGSGHWHGKFSTPRGRRSVALKTCRTADQANERKTFIAAQLARLVDGGKAEFAE
jgi:hypothetical protein